MLHRVDRLGHICRGLQHSRVCLVDLGPVAAWPMGINVIEYNYYKTYQILPKNLNSWKKCSRDI